jgi:hypothetical protein
MKTADPMRRKERKRKMESNIVDLRQLYTYAKNALSVLT